MMRAVPNSLAAMIVNMWFDLVHNASQSLQSRLLSCSGGNRDSVPQAASAQESQDKAPPRLGCIQTTRVWLKIEQEGLITQVLVHFSTYQGSILVPVF